MITAISPLLILLLSVGRVLLFVTPLIVYGQPGPLPGPGPGPLPGPGPGPGFHFNRDLITDNNLTESQQSLRTSDLSGVINPVNETTSIYENKSLQEK
jgi:hypothetical protein